MEILVEEFYNSNYKERLKMVNIIIRQLHKKKIILYGAGAIGKTLKLVFDKLNLSIEFFVDRKYKEILDLDGIEVKALEELKKVNKKEYLVIICVSSEFILSYQNDIDVILKEYCPFADRLENGRELAYLLKYFSCSQDIEKGKKLVIPECINCGYETRGCEICDNYLRKQSGLLSEQIFSKNRKFEHSFGYLLGNYCTLRCKNCIEMIPYHKKRYFVNKEEVLKDCKHLIASCIFMPFIFLVGGEPFLYPDLEELLRELLKIKNLGYIKVVTNGTVIPKDSLCEILQNERIILLISNYTDAVTGELLSNIYKTREKLKQKGLSYLMSYSKTWLDLNCNERKKSKKELQYNFEHCYRKDCHGLHRGILYRCQHQYAGGVQTGRFDIQEAGIIHIHDYTVEELRKKCDEFEEISYIDACSYCNWPFDAEEVPAAEQVK